MPYDPCGMVMDIARTATDRDCLFFADNPTAATIHWYRAPAGAKVFPGVHKIDHLAWYTEPWKASGVGESYGTNQKWNNGFTPPTAAGQDYFGPLAYFRTGAPFDPDVNVLRDTWGLARACTAIADCFVLMEPAYNPIVLTETGDGIELEICV